MKDESDQAIVSDSPPSISTVIPSDVQMFPTFPRTGQRTLNPVDLKRTQGGRRSHAGPPYTTIYQLLVYSSFTYICTHLLSCFLYIITSDNKTFNP